MASPGLLSALQQGMPIETYYNNIRNFAASASSPEEMIAAAAEYGISGEDIMRATGESPLSTYSPDSNPSNFALAQALESIPNTIDTGVQYNPQTRDVDQGLAAQTDFNVVNPRTGQMENVTPASEFIPGAPANQFVVSSGQEVFQQGGKEYQPVNLVTVGADGSVSPSGMFNIEKNELSDFNRIGTAIATAVAAAAMGPALGASLGLSGTAATVVGNAVVNGTLTGVITGDAEKAALAALTAAAGSYVAQSGIISDTLSSLGLEDVADFLDTNLVTKNVADSINNGTVSSVVDSATNTITTIGTKVGANTIADTITAAASGLLTPKDISPGVQEVTQTATKPAAEVTPVDLTLPAITSTLTPEGVQEITQTAAKPAAEVSTGDVVSGAVAGALTPTDLPGGGQEVVQTGTKPATTGTVTDGLLTAGGNIAVQTLPGDVTEITQTATKPKPVTEEGLSTLPLVVPPPASGPLLSTNAGTQPAGDAPATPGLTNLLGLLSGTGLLSNLANAGIDYTLLSELENMTAGKADEVRRAFEGAAKDVQFTPYTVTTGAGSSTFGTDAQGRPTATVTASPDYQGVRSQALQQAGTTLGAINPANSAQSLYDRARALSAPTEQRQQEQLLSTLGARGLLGIGRNLPTVGGTTTAVNPFVESLLSAQRTADANLALQSQQLGTQEAMRQQQLAQGLLGMGQGIDIAAERALTPSLQFGSTLASNQQMNANRGLQALETGQKLATAYDLANLDARTQLLKAQAEAAKGVTNTVVPKVFDLFGDLFG